MNRPPETFVCVQEDRLLTFATDCFRHAGLDDEQAALIARLLVNSDLRGVRSHGTRALRRYCAELENGQLNPNPQVKTVTETPAAVLLDGDGGLGYMPTMRATQMAIDRARQVGIGMGMVRGIGHYGSAGHYTRVCQAAGCIGYSVQGPEGYGDYIQGTQGRQTRSSLAGFGCPPASWAFPGGQEPGVVLDGGTPTLMGVRDPDTYNQLLGEIPSGVFKGIGYTAVSNLLCASLTGLAEQDARAVRERWPEAKEGSMVLAIHIPTFTPPGAFTAESDRMVRDVAANYDPLPGYDRSLLPGAIEEELAAQHRAEGVRYGEAEQDAARGLAERYGLALPWE